MRVWLRQHRQAFLSAVRRLGLLNTMVIGVALALPAGGYAVVESLRAAAARLTLEPQISVFLPAEAKRTETDALGLTGLVLTKLDGTAKGGVVCAIARERPIPLLFVGVGEEIDDLRPFAARDFAEALVG